MRVSIILIGLGLGAALITGPVQAQTNDHLQCYQVKGDLKLKGLLDLTTPQFGLEEGCKINKAKFFCVPATKSNVDVVDRDKQPVTPLPFSAPPAPGDRICWKVKCPEPFPDDQTVTDQFGTQTLTKFKTKLLCTPAVKGTVFCGDGTVNGSEVCEPTDDSACPGLCQADCSCGVAPPTCGNGSIDGNDDCDDPDLGGATCESLGFESGTLACTIGCGLDVSGCTPVPSGTCGNGSIDGNDDCDGLDLGGATCESLGFQGGTLACSAGCGLDVSGCVVTCGNATLDPGEDCDFGDLGGATCPDQGFSFGTLACGAGCTFDTSGCTNTRFVDNGDGTITDVNTGLMWEKKSDDGSIHDKDTVHSWDNAFAVHVATLNSSTFAGHTDWRVPNVQELQSIVDYETFNPSVDPVFNTGCVPACTVTTCSCTVDLSLLDVKFDYWSSSTFAISPFGAWRVEFFSGIVLSQFKIFGLFVRAVRGGL